MTGRAGLTAYNKDHDQWQGEHRAWMEELSHWIVSERRVVGIIYELEAALPVYRTRLNRFREMVKEHEVFLERNARNIGSLRPAPVDEQCETNLKDLRNFGISPCQDCEPQCVDGAEESHSQAAARHESMKQEQARLKIEYESALKQLQELAKGLQACLDKG